MKVSEKIKIIIRLSGLTQESLAKELGVSFVTLNSWINDKSIPHKKKIEIVNKVFSKYSNINIDEIRESTKKEVICKKIDQNILNKIIERTDIYEEFVLSLTYNTNKIEGSTLTEDETAAVIFRNEIIRNKGLTEHLEAKNHQQAIKLLFNHLKNSKIDEKLILKLHGVLMSGVRDDAGNYRKHGVRIVGSNVPTANYIKVPELMKDLVCQINKKENNTIKHVAIIHSRFEKIHPFSDGNGRIGRLIMAAMLLLNGLPPAIIKAKDKKFYLSYLRKSQLKEDSSFLEDFVCDAILNGLKIIEN